MNSGENHKYSLAHAPERPPRALPDFATATHAFAQYSLSLSHPDVALVWALLALGLPETA